MPNWCENRLVVSGPKEEVERFKQAVKLTSPEEETWGPTDLSLNKLYPLPKGEVRNWCNWCNDHWGTKWDVEAKLVSDEKAQLEYTFDSAWTPPIRWMERVSLEFPKLQLILKYEEPDIGKAQVSASPLRQPQRQDRACPGGCHPPWTNTTIAMMVFVAMVDVPGAVLRPYRRLSTLR